MFVFFFSSRRRHTRCSRDWSSDVCSSDLFASAAALSGSHIYSIHALQSRSTLCWQLRPDPAYIARARITGTTNSTTRLSAGPEGWSGDPSGDDRGSVRHPMHALDIGNPIDFKVLQ